MNPILAGIIGGAGVGMTNIAGQLDEQQKRDQAERLARDKMAQEQQYHDALVTIERDKLNQATTPYDALFKMMGQPVPGGLDPNQRVPIAMADKIIAGLQETQKAQREQERALSTGGALATGLANRYGTGDVVGATGPERPRIDDPVIATLADILKAGGYTPAALPAIEAATKYEADKRLQEGQQAQQRAMLARFGFGAPDAPVIAAPGQGPTVGGGLEQGAEGVSVTPASAAPAVPGAPSPNPLAKLVVTPQMDAKGNLTISTSAPTDPMDMRAIAKYGMLHRNLSQPQAEENYQAVTAEKLNVGTGVQDEAIARGYRSYADAPAPVRLEIKRYVDDKALRVSQQQGAAGIQTRAQAERDLPLAQVNLHGGGMVWDRRNSRPADPLNTTLNDAKADPSRYIVIDRDKQMPQLTSIGESKILIAQFVPLVQGLTTTPGANFGQAASMWAQNKFGVDNPGVAFDAMRGTVLRMAGAMQGSRVQLSDQDRKAVEGMLPTPMDTAQSGMRRLQTVARILDSMEGALLGDTAALNQANLLLRQSGGSGTLGGGMTMPGSTAPAGGSADDRAKRKFLGQ
jgi:hypothetical protein